MPSEPSAVQPRDFRHTEATTLSWHSGSTGHIPGARGRARVGRPSSLALKDRPVTCSRSGLWRAEDGTTPIDTFEAGDEPFLVLSGG